MGSSGAIIIIAAVLALVAIVLIGFLVDRIWRGKW